MQLYFSLTWYVLHFWEGFMGARVFKKKFLNPERSIKSFHLNKDMKMTNLGRKKIHYRLEKNYEYS